MSAVITLTGENFEREVLNSPIPVFIDFWAQWCGDCIKIAPFIDQLADEYSGKIKIAKVNTEDEPELAEKHNVYAIPRLVLYKNGEIIAEQAEVMFKRDLEAMFKDHV